ncbi:hypothetical protein L6452_13391 [Arctium lappa]|uniref:Uncharacterized protein n=1 Tax=Arctium lappa TaxID=4217 RepID=A0ACB9CIG0_ARCLA|nr:hypothetical protein L6452_13391 [Arctium lappa]
MKWLTKPTPINPLFFTFFLFFKQSLSSDPDYEACVPNRCSVNGPNISYPFFIYGLQNSTCGYPGLELHCRNGSPILRISENDFRVLHIDYDNRNLRLQSTAILPDQTLSCSSNVRNLTLDPNRFQLNNATTTNLVFISNCLNNTNTTTLDRYRIRSCEKSVELVMLANDTNLRTATEICGSGGGAVKTPVELGGGEGVVDGENYAEVMRRGFVLSWFAADCGVCRENGGRCGFNTTAFQFRCFCPDRPHMVSCKPEPTISTAKSTNHTPIIIAVVCGSVFALLAVFIAAVFMIRRGYKRKAFAYFSSKDKSRDLEDASVFGVPVFSYTELQDATHNFDPSQELGDGGFGTVYYGKLRDGREVAVKRLYEHNYKRVQQFMNEVDILTRLRHKHLVSLYGCTSRRSRELLLVYEYISNGTVADHLHGELVKTIPLTWPIRMKIAVETASALVYLHASEIIHRDVKTNNILLDHNFCVKVADFGLSRLLPNDMTHVSTAPQGTPGYVDPEYHQCYQLTDKSDVYSFGVVLIELISSMPAIDISRSREEISLANMAINRIQKCALDELIDPFLRSNSDTERMTRLVAELAFRCLQFDSDSRPTMIEVLEVLKGIQGDDIENLGELKSCTKPPASQEIEDVGLLKGQITASPISVTAKWHSTSSGLNTPNTSSV